MLEGANPTEVVNGIKEVMEGYDLPRGVKVDFTGEQEEQAKELSFLSGALLIAVFLIFLILVSQFNSASTPFISSYCGVLFNWSFPWACYSVWNLSL